MKRLTWHEPKRLSNLKKHKLDFAHLVDFDEASALVAEDTRGKTDPKFAYSEPRHIALGLMRGTLVVLVYSETKNGWRVISLRPANEKEAKLWLGK
ncbi:MAG: BrnT family toxin [Rhizomicrobium sp.]